MTRPFQLFPVLIAAPLIRKIYQKSPPLFPGKSNAPKTFTGYIPGTKNRGRLNHQEDYRRKIAALSQTGNPAFKLLKTIMIETISMPHAMSLGAGHPQGAPTFAQKYPDKLGTLLDKLAVEILEALA